MRSLQEAIVEVSAPGQPFEVVSVERNGATVRAFKNAPPTLRDYFASARGCEDVFLVYEDEEWTFARVMRQADALGYALVHHYGVRPGDRVGIAMRNYPEWIVSFAAITSIGAISVSLNAWWTETEIAYAIGDAGLRVMIVDHERVTRASSAASAGVSLIVVRPPEEATYDAHISRWTEVVSEGHEMPAVDIDAERDATILYTSGTTGQPKGAVSTHGAISQSIMAYASNAAVQSARREPGETGSGQAPCFILIVPLFHVTGCVPVMLSCFAWHFKLVMMYRWEPERALELIERHRVTNFVGVPTQAWDLMESPSFSKYDTSSLVAVGGGGAPAPAALVARVGRAFRRGGPTLGYGMTETNAYGPGNYGEDYLNHPASTGRVPTIVLDVEIRDEGGRRVGPGERGEIWMCSPALFRGYWGRPEATAETLVGGWLRTGDVGYIDDEGFLYLEDRVKDMILRAGENVYSAEVESAIYEHPAVYEAAVFGVAHERLGEEVACVVQVRDGHELSEDVLREHLRSRLAPYKIPTRVAVTRSPLPRNPAGKFLKREMPARYFDSVIESASRV